MDNLWKKKLSWIRDHFALPHSNKQPIKSFPNEFISNSPNLSSSNCNFSKSCDLTSTEYSTTVQCSPMPKIGQYKYDKASNDKEILPKNVQCQMQTTSVEKRPGVKIGDYEFLVLIGKGYFSEVFLAWTPDCKPCAIKAVRKEKLRSERGALLIENERRIMTDCSSHPFILSLYHCFQTDKCLFLVSEFCSGGDIIFHLNELEMLSENQAQFFCSEIACALDFLHRQAIAYRDCKGENLLINHLGHIVLADFGLAATGVSEVHGARTLCGTLAYLPPEVISICRPLDYGYLIDFWAFGTLMYDLLIGSLPFFDPKMETMCMAILSQELRFPADVHLSAEVKHLIGRLLHRRPEYRLGSSLVGGFKAIQEHPFFENVEWDKLENASAYPAPIQLKPASAKRKVVLTQTSNSGLTNSEIQIDVSNFSSELIRMPLENRLSSIQNGECMSNSEVVMKSDMPPKGNTEGKPNSNEIEATNDKRSSGVEKSTRKSIPASNHFPGWDSCVT